MAIGQLPPWLDVRPEQFVRAASEGAQAGLAVARLNQAADEAAQRAGEHGKEFEEAQALRKWEQQQQMQMHAEQMQAAQKKSADELAARTMYQRSMMEARTASEKDRRDTQAETMRHNLATESRGQGQENLTTTTKDGKTFQLRGGKWYHIPDVRAPMDTVTETIPAVQATDAVPPVAAKPKSTILGIPIPFTGQTASPGAPAIPGHGEQRRTRHVPVDIPTPMGALPPTGGAAPPVTPVVLPPGPDMPAFPALPPTDKREKGQTYSIPGKAPHTWTGTGWVPYTAPSHDETPAAAPIPDPGPSTAMPDDEEDTSNAAD